MKHTKINYPLLEAEIEKRKISKEAIADALAISMEAFYLKLNGERRFTLEQALTIQKTWFPDIPVEELFTHEKEVTS